MTKEEFLSDQTRSVVEIFERYGSYTPTFAVLYEDGTTESFAFDLGSEESKDFFSFFMRSVCKNPSVIASVFTTSGWSSNQAEKQKKRPSECVDKEETILVIYNTRDNDHELRMYKLLKNGKLNLETSSTDFGGRFSNPFYNGRLTKEEKAKAIEDFQEKIGDTLCHVFKKLNAMAYMLFFLEDTPEQVCVRRIKQEEWNNKQLLNNIITAKCQEVETLAFILAFPKENEIVDVILVAEDRQVIDHYRMDYNNRTLIFMNSEVYNGEFSDSFKLDVKVLGTKNPFRGQPIIRTI